MNRSARGLAGQGDEAAADREATASRAQLDAEEATELANREAALLVGKPVTTAPPRLGAGALTGSFGAQVKARDRPLYERPKGV